MFKLESEPWIKADLIVGGQELPLMTWRDGSGFVIHLCENKKEGVGEGRHYSFFLGNETEDHPLHRIITSIPADVLSDVADRLQTPAVSTADRGNR